MIQHFKFCRRQWALIHIEQQWADNVHTAVGELLHKRVHDPILKETRKGLITARALPVFSRSMGVSGECDVVEFCPCEDGIQLRGHRGTFSVYPVEYKKGKSKLTEEDKLQLAAQAMCLEEMFSTEIYMFLEMHKYYEKGYTPKVKYSKSCNACSLKDICIPKLGKVVSVKTYLNQRLEGEKQ